MKMRSLALLLAAAALAGCGSDPVGALGERLTGAWSRFEVLPVALPEGPQANERMELWFFDGTTYQHDITYGVPTTGPTTVALSELGTYTARRGVLTLVRQKLFVRAPGTQVPPGAPGAEPVPVTPVTFTLPADLRGDSLVLGGCGAEPPCYAQPGVFRQYAIDPW